jgi:uncharacterized integral membrane protein (TIGR00697 family)
MFDKKTRLFLVLGGFFIANALIAEMIGGKIFSLEATLGFEPIYFSLFGEDQLSFNLTAGVLLWPVVFIMTDIINEYYGMKGVKFLSYLTVGLISFAFIVIYGAIQLVPAEWWIASFVDHGVPNAQLAFGTIMGQGLWIIIGSLVAFLVGQLLDVFVFHKIKKATGDKMVWLRATGSTLISQGVDSFIVLFIAFYLGQNWTFAQVFAIASVNYIYKFVVAVGLTPLIYLAHNAIDGYLGLNEAEALKTKAMNNAL